MKIYAIQTGSVQIKRNQIRGVGHGIWCQIRTLADREWTDPLPIFAWVIEHPEGLFVVDTGETSRTSEPGYFPFWHPYFRLGMRTNVSPDQEIGNQMQALGLPPKEVRWVVLTHLHTDHAGGLHHFPEAEVLVSRKEFQIASGLGGQIRGYLPQHWPTWFKHTCWILRRERSGRFRAA